MIKRLSLTLLAVLSIVDSGHCQPATARIPRAQVQLAIWHDGTREDLRPVGTVTRLVQRDHSGLVLTIRVLPPETMLHQLKQWSSQDNAGLPDIVIVPDRWLPMFAHALQPLNALVDGRQLQCYPPSVRERLRHAGKLYGIPWITRSRALFYRPDLLQAAGVLPPKTWNDALIAARRCHRPPDVYGFGLAGIRDDSGARMFLQMLWSLGGELPVVGDPGRTNMAALEAALGLYRDLHGASEPEVLAWDQHSLEGFFEDGRVAMMVADSDFAEYLGAECGDLKWATAPLPAGPSAVGQIDVDAACILKTTRHLEASAKVLASLLGSEQAEARLALGGIPARSDLIDKHRLDPGYAAFIAGIDRARGVPAERWDAAQAVISDALFALLTGRQGVAETAQFIATSLSGPAPVAPYE